METVGPEGEFLDHFDGRTLNPGHALEGVWFILREAQFRNKDPELLKMGTTMLKWMWEIGWDKEVHQWAFKNFPDPDFGEWYGYLHRDGRILVPLKGNIWKGPFHVPRMYFMAWQICESLLSNK